MAHLITVHLDHNGKEILVNADRVIRAERIATATPGKTYTEIHTTGGIGFTIRETLDELKKLSRAS